MPRGWVGGWIVSESHESHKNSSGLQGNLPNLGTLDARSVSHLLPACLPLHDHEYGEGDDHDDQCAPVFVFCPSGKFKVIH